MLDLPFCANPWIRAPMIMIIEPNIMDPRRPTQASTLGMKGSERIAPREYAAAMMPLSDPAGWLKSDCVNADYTSVYACYLTLDP